MAHDADVAATPSGEAAAMADGLKMVDVLERFDAIRGSLHPDRLESLLTRQTQAAVEVLAADAAGISMLLADGMRVPLAASSQQAVEAESLQFTLGQGPCLEAFTVGRTVLVPDLTEQSSHAWTAWPAYAEQLLARTAFRAVYAIPLGSGGLSIGTLSLYRREPGHFSGADLGDALAVANHIFFDLLDTGTFSGDVQPAFQWLNLPLARIRSVVWQAVGMAVIEMGLSTADALALLRSYCYGHNQLLDHVAADIVARRVPLEELSP